MSDLAMNGNCAVALIEKGELVPGDPVITSEHDGLTYAFPGEEAKEMFDADSGKYAIAEEYEAVPDRFIRDSAS